MTPCEHDWCRLSPADETGVSFYCRKCGDTAFQRSPRCRCNHRSGDMVFTGSYYQPWAAKRNFNSEGYCYDCGLLGEHVE